MLTRESDVGDDGNDLLFFSLLVENIPSHPFLSVPVLPVDGVSTRGTGTKLMK